MSRTRSTRSARLASIAVAATFFALVSPVAARAASNTPTFSVRPAHFDPKDPATRAYFKPLLAPGSTYSDDVVVTNPGSSALTLMVYPVDGLTGQTSGAVYGNHKDQLRRAGTWVSVATSTATIPARSQRNVGFTVRVPSNAVPGDHLAGVAFELAPTKASSGHFAITQVFRMVVGVAILVPGPATSEVHIGTISLGKLPGTDLPAVFVKIGDPGRLLVKPFLAVTLRNAAGYNRTVSRQLDTILPGDTIEYPLSWPETLRAGSYTATVKATFDGRTVQATQPVSLGSTLRQTTGGGHPTPAPAAPRSGFPPIAMIAVALGGILIGVLASRRRRRPEPPAAEPAPTPEDAPAASEASRSRERVGSSRRNH